MGISIAVVEDNSGDLYLIKRAIEKQNLQVLHFADGEEAITGLCSNRLEHAPALILLDLNLPKRSGIEVLTAVRQSSCLPDVPVVVLTSSRSLVDREQAEKFSANDYVSKPPTLNEFMEVIGRTVRNFLPSADAQKA